MLFFGCPVIEEYDLYFEGLQLMFKLYSFIEGSMALSVSVFFLSLRAHMV